MPETLYGTDAVVYQILEKMELAIRRAVAIRYPQGVTEDKSAILCVANELQKMLKEMRA